MELTLSWFSSTETLGAGSESEDFFGWSTWWSVPVFPWLRLLVLFLKDSLCIVLVYKEISRSANYMLKQPRYLVLLFKTTFLNLLWLNISGERSRANIQKFYLHLCNSCNSTITHDWAHRFFLAGFMFLINLILTLDDRFIC